MATFNVWNDIALVEIESWGKHILAKPNSAKRVQQTLVKVICDTASILDLAKHIAYTDPVNTLKGKREIRFSKSQLFSTLGTAYVLYFIPSLLQTRKFTVKIGTR